MAGKPKPPHLRQRVNKTTTRASLSSAEAAASNPVPDLPDRNGGWHPMVLEWWASVWQSPMASEYLAADMKGGLYLLASLHQVRWTAKDAHELIKAAAEIRLQEVRFGLSPIDRHRLQWSIEQGESAAERTKARRKPKADPAIDPRSVLKVAS